MSAPDLPKVPHHPDPDAAYDQSIDQAISSGRFEGGHYVYGDQPPATWFVAYLGYESDTNAPVWSERQVDYVEWPSPSEARWVATRHNLGLPVEGEEAS